MAGARVDLPSNAGLPDQWLMIEGLSALEGARKQVTVPLADPRG